MFRGYMAPEYAIRGQVTKKSDVYGYGVLLLEIVSGRRNTNTRFPSEELNTRFPSEELLEKVSPSCHMTCDFFSHNICDKYIELHAPTSSTQKLNLMRKASQFTYTPTLPLTCRLPQAAYVNIRVDCNCFN
jgi:hypothetical protein